MTARCTVTPFLQQDVKGMDAKPHRTHGGFRAVAMDRHPSLSHNQQPPLSTAPRPVSQAGPDGFRFIAACSAGPSHERGRPCHSPGADDGG
jgi:hypothetical protein